MSDPATTPGGLNRYVAALRCAWRESGRTVRSVVASGEVRRTDGDDVIVPASGGLAARSLRVARAVAELERPGDVLNTHFAPYQLALRHRRRRARSTIVTFHGPWALEGAAEGEPRPAVVAKRTVERCAYSAASRFVTLSEAFAALLVDRYGVPRELVTVVRPGVDLDHFVPGSEPGSDRPVVFCVRRLRRRMGLEVLLDAWRRVVDEVPDALLVIAGSGPLEGELRSQIARWHLSESVRLVGFVDDAELRRWYQVATLTVVPTVELEGFGLVTLESLACGTPALVTDVGGLGELPRLLDPALVVAPGDPEALARRAVELLSGSRSRPQRSECRRFAEAYTWAATVEGYERIVHELERTR